MMTTVLKTNVVKRQVILADGTILRNEQIPAEAKAFHGTALKGGSWVDNYADLVQLRRTDRMRLSEVKEFKHGKNNQYVLNGWTIGWCWVVADSPVSSTAARAAYKAAGKFYLDGSNTKALPYLVDGVHAPVLFKHGGSIPQAAESGRKMADALLTYGITSRVYVMTDKQFGMGCVGGIKTLKGLRLTMDEKHPLLRTTWVLTQKQSVPVYQTSL